jgi:thioredoxin-like negative regulator of GroEL
MKVSEWIGKEALSRLVSSPTPQVVLFAAHWCGFCSRFIAMANGLSTSFGGELKLVDTDDADESLWDTYAIGIVPTLVVFQKAEQIFRRDGVAYAGLQQADLEAALQAASAAKG